MRLASIFLNVELLLFFSLEKWIWKAISHSCILCQPMQLGSVQSSLNQQTVFGIKHCLFCFLHSPPHLPPPQPLTYLK